MAILLRPTNSEFPPVECADDDGLLAVGSDLSNMRLIEAYRLGIFPWYCAGQPILWWSPDPRCVLYPDSVRITRSLKKRMRNAGFVYTLDHCFEQVVRSCAGKRDYQPGTWITSEMIEAYGSLHDLGLAHSVEVWHDGTLVGGLYGVALGGIFYGESMFTRKRDASKAALVKLSQLLENWRYKLIDCQVTSEHLLTMGAIEVPRDVFISQLEHGLTRTGKPGEWSKYQL